MNQKEELAIAVSQLRSGNFPEAIRHCDKSLAKYPGDAKFLCLAGQASIGLKKFDSAEKYINAESHIVYANAVGIIGAHEEAINEQL